LKGSLFGKSTISGLPYLVGWYPKSRDKLATTVPGYGILPNSEVTTLTAMKLLPKAKQILPGQTVGEL